MSDALIILTVMAAGINLGWTFIPRSDTTLFVSVADGSDWNSGYNKDSALKTIQAAADRAQAGDSILIAPGVYPETLYLRRGGDASKPVTLRAEIPGTVTISNAAPPATLNSIPWTNEGAGVFSSLPPWPIYSLRVGEAASYHLRWGGEAELLRMVAQGSAWPLSVYEEGTGLLYLFLPQGKSPADHELVTHQKIPPPREWYNVKNANVWVEAGYIVLDGLQFEFAVGAGIRLWNAPSVTVQNCVFQGASAGVDSRPQVGPSTDFVLEHSLYHNYPQYHWLRDSMSWQEVYRHYSTYSLVSNTPAGSIIRSNIVTQFGDGLGVNTGNDLNPPPTRIEGNLFFRGTDDALEIEGQARNVVVRNNLIFDVHESLGLSPVLAGPVIIENNLFMHPSDGVNGAQIKLLARPRGNEPAPTIRNIRISHNTFVGNWLSWWTDSPMEDIVISDNVFRVQNVKSPALPPAVLSKGNDIEVVTPEEILRPGLVVGWRTTGGEKNGRDTNARAFVLPDAGPDWLDKSSLPATRAIEQEIDPALWRQ